MSGRHSAGAERAVPTVQGHGDFCRGWAPADEVRAACYFIASISDRRVIRRYHFADELEADWARVLAGATAEEIGAEPPARLPMAVVHR
jgi:hypothetical protein